MAQKITRPATPVKTSTRPQDKADKAPAYFVFDRTNYRLLIISVVVVALGFILMSGTTDIYSTTKIVIAPLVVLAGFALGFVSILKKPEAKA